jgi:phospholipid/cholesterol/gamma-HCH transport system substrate-binding protein
MTVKANNLKLGIFITAGTICFIIALYFLGRKQNLFGNTIEIKAVFNNVNGLQKGNNVRFSGINIGTVKEVVILNDTSIEVQMAVKQDIQEFIKVDAIATLGNDGLMGNKLVNISPGDVNSAIIQEGGVLRSINELDADDMLRRLEETNYNISIITAGLVGIVEKINNGEGPLGKLLNDRDMANNLSLTLANIQELSKQTATLSNKLGKSLGRIESSENTLGMLLNDTAFAAELRYTISELKTFGSNTEKVSSDLRTIVEEVQKGKGTMGALIADSLASENIKQSLQNLQEGSKAFNENMEALKHNFLFRRYFKKQEKKK